MISGDSSARLTPDSKATLRKTIQDLRDVLLRDLRRGVVEKYQWNLPFEEAEARLSQPMRERRRRLAAALAERAAEEGGTKEAHERAMVNAVKEAGATLLNRLVLIRHLEAVGLSRPAVVTGGWKSRGYQEFRGYAPALIEDETQGYGVLLHLLFDELSVRLPGLFGEVGLTALFPAPPDTLRAVIEALDEVPAEAWRDDMTLGWVYQYWNDPDREALDAKLHERGKLESHEIASKTQMFTERYMVEWLLHNSLGPTWLAMCKKNGWVAEVEQHRVLEELDARRGEWRKKREAGEVALDALMPTSGPLEEAWKYYVPQPLPDAVVTHAPASIRELKLIDPACGSGHFLVVAFDLLVGLYREEARHRGESWTDRQIAEWILENNLHGVDIDPRAVQIAAAAIFLKACTLAKDASPSHVNLVAPMLRLSALDRKDPALIKLERDIELETGIPPELTQQLMEVLTGVDHLGTLLKVGDAVDRAIEAYRGKLGKANRQGDLFAQAEAEPRATVNKADAKKLILESLNSFLANHAGEEDLGLRLRGEQLTAGLRFASIVREGAYHLVVANPPYQGTSRMKNAGYIAKHYPRGKADLYAAFLERGLDLCRPGGASAMVTMRSWMFLSGFTALREHLLQTYDLRAIGDVDRGAFEEILDEVVATTMSVFRRSEPKAEPSIAIQPTPLSDKSRDSHRTARKRSALLTQVGKHEFSAKNYRLISGNPLLYWWTTNRLQPYLSQPLVGENAKVATGLQTSSDARFLRRPWEVNSHMLPRQPTIQSTWVPIVAGAAGKTWLEPVDDIVKWKWKGFEVRSFPKSYPRNYASYFAGGVAFCETGNTFSARLHCWPSVIGDKGPTVCCAPADARMILCALNRSDSRELLESLNPGLDFQVGDVERLPLAVVEQSDTIVETLATAFLQHERCREPSPEFQSPGPSVWKSTQQWAQRSVDRARGDPLPAYAPTAEPPTLNAQLSFLLGVAIGRFDRNGGGILSSPPKSSLEAGILFCSDRNSLNGSALEALLREWRERGSESTSSTLEEWLRDEFFEYHRKLYENRPIYLPLSSAKKSFVALISIHQWVDATLSTLLSDHLLPERRAIEGALVDLQAARNQPDRSLRAASEKSYQQHKRWLEELEVFIRKVQDVAEQGPMPSDDTTEPREVNTPYRMDLDDGVMVNSAALWPLLEPMWKEPKKWWKDLANAKGRKDYDWSHLAARYFPSRVDAKCRKDLSLAVAHGCFWKYHPEKAYQWELRLQDEIGPDFKLDEKDSDVLRAAFMQKQPSRARELEAAEQARRERKARKQDQEELELSEAESEDEETE